MLGCLHLAKYISKHFCDFIVNLNSEFQCLMERYNSLGGIYESESANTNRGVLSSGLAWKDGEM